MHALVEPVVAWFDEHARDLPWRAPGRTAWGVLVSEVMLQQTPVARVEPVWRAWMQRWPTAADLAAAGPDDVLRAWGRLGYPRRALRLQECARTVVEHHGGELPADEAALLALPGIGTYTAAAVTAFARGRRSVVVDTNVRRVLARALEGRALPDPHLSAAELRRAGDVVPDDDATAARWNAAVMELGALVCTARAPRCGACPVATTCRWRLAGMPADELAHRRRRQAWQGTDRQARGALMAALRDAPGPLPAATLARAWPDDAQRARALTSLVVDGLAVVDDGAGGAVRLPGGAA
ncbi:A/G-specific adenine glycosylase [Actinotalea sp. JY-7876]|uniref:A/G-specific adenine glycosylase n=2 Tax=unclassified Actinotalea TaxID=2638618 RepID=UPI0021049E0E|nr:A/G-specific adenine glycosylase [Actinotalea sp. JY-7876]